MLTAELWGTIFDYLSEEDLKAFVADNHPVREGVTFYLETNRRRYHEDYLALLDYYERRLKLPPKHDSTMTIDEGCLAISIGLLKLHPDLNLQQGEALKRLLKLIQISLSRFLSERELILNEYIHRLRTIFPVSHASWSVPEIEQLIEDIEKQIYAPVIIGNPLQAIGSPQKQLAKQNVSISGDSKCECRTLHG